jgi:hypothetical protein
MYDPHSGVPITKTAYDICMQVTRTPHYFELIRGDRTCHPLEVVIAYNSPIGPKGQNKMCMILFAEIKHEQKCT